MNVRFSMPRFIGILGEIYSKDEVQKMKEQYEAQLAALKRENERLQAGQSPGENGQNLK